MYAHDFFFYVQKIRVASLDILYKMWVLRSWDTYPQMETHTQTHKYQPISKNIFCTHGTIIAENTFCIFGDNLDSSILCHPRFLLYSDT